MMIFRIDKMCFHISNKLSGAKQISRGAECFRRGERGQMKCRSCRRRGKVEGRSRRRRSGRRGEA